MRKKKTNTLSRLACLLLTVSLLWLLPACGSDSASPFPPAEETVRAAAEKLDWTLLPEETQVWAEDQILYTLKTNSQMDVALSCAVVEGKRTLTENCTAAGLPAEPVFTWEDWKKAISLAETLYGGFSESLIRTIIPRNCTALFTVTFTIFPFLYRKREENSISSPFVSSFVVKETSPIRSCFLPSTYMINTFSTPLPKN